MSRHETYAGAGVQVERAEKFVERLKRASKRAGHDKLWKAAGGYACVYPTSDATAMAFTTDGVGTKLLTAIELKKLDTLGIDLVAMCANDLLCVGARPSIFLDYMAVGKLEDDDSDALIHGIVRGCDLAGMILAGGETAEMPGLYDAGHFDLAGFAAGEVKKEMLITGDDIAPGQKIVGVASSGIHSNGLSLARKVLGNDRAALAQLLEPTLIYTSAVNELLESHRQSITGMAHITGGGWRNMLRLKESTGINIHSRLPLPSIFTEISKSVSDEEMYKTFNMGMGFVVFTKSKEAEIIETFRRHNFTAALVGEVTDRAGEVSIQDFPFKLYDKHAPKEMK